MGNLIKIIVGYTFPYFYTLVPFYLRLDFALVWVSSSLVVHYNWWPLFSFLPFMFAPFPEALGKLVIGPRVAMSETDPDQTSGFEHFTSFTTSVMISIGVGINLMLWHVQVISGAQFAVEFTGSVIMLVALFAFYASLQCTQREESS